LIVPFAAPVNIRQPLEEPLIAIKVALLAHSSVIPPLQPNTMNNAIAKFAVLVNIRQPAEEPPNAMKIALLARTSVIPLPQANTMDKTTVLIVVLARTQHQVGLVIVQFAVPVNIRQQMEDPLIAMTAALLAST
jgi:hypothetical protein